MYEHGSIVPIEDDEPKAITFRINLWSYSRNMLAVVTPRVYKSGNKVEI